MEYLMYLCPKCKKIYKVKGRDKKINCSVCRIPLIYTETSIEEWENMDKNKRDEIKNRLVNLVINGADKEISQADREDKAEQPAEEPKEESREESKEVPQQEPMMNKESINGNFSQSEPEKVCPRCGTMQPNKYKFCHECGYDFYNGNKDNGSKHNSKEDEKKSASSEKNNNKIVGGFGKKQVIDLNKKENITFNDEGKKADKPVKMRAGKEKKKAEKKKAEKNSSGKISPVIIAAAAVLVLGITVAAVLFIKGQILSKEANVAYVPEVVWDDEVTDNSGGVQEEIEETGASEETVEIEDEVEAEVKMEEETIEAASEEEIETEGASEEAVETEEETSEEVIEIEEVSEETEEETEVSQTEAQNSESNDDLMVTTPNLVGKSLGEVSKILKENGLTAIASYVDSKDYLKDIIVLQDIEPGTQIEKNTQLKLHISRGF